MWKLITVSHHLATFDVHWSSRSEDTTYLRCHMTSQEHMIEESYDVTGWGSSLFVDTLPSLLAIDTVVIEIYF